MPTELAMPPSVSYSERLGGAAESTISAVSWAAIIAGGVAAASLTVVLVALGSGLGLASVSPWRNAGTSATAFTIGAGIWLIVVQWLSSALGGYLTGRLRTKWVGTHTHEVFFRDTAHGFLAWALASVIGALLLTSAVSSAIGTSTQAAATVASGAAQGVGAGEARDYDVDSLYRGEKPDMAGSDPAVRTETMRILAHGIRSGDIPPADHIYLAQLIASRTGISVEDAQKRVNDVISQETAAAAKAREAADTARKSASAVAIFTALSMLIGAFIATASAALGGSLRDEV